MVVVDASSEPEASVVLATRSGVTSVVGHSVVTSHWVSVVGTRLTVIVSESSVVFDVVVDVVDVDVVIIGIRSVVEVGDASVVVVSDLVGIVAVVAVSGT